MMKLRSGMHEELLDIYNLEPKSMAEKVAESIREK